MVDWRKQTLLMTGGLACVYFLIMCLMVAQLHLQERRVSFLSEDQEHEVYRYSTLYAVHVVCIALCV